MVQESEDYSCCVRYRKTEHININVFWAGAAVSVDSSMTRENGESFKSHTSSCKSVGEMTFLISALSILEAAGTSFFKVSHNVINGIF